MRKRCRIINGEAVWYDPDTMRAAPSATPNIARDWQAIKSPVDGTVIEGRAQHREYMKQKGLRLLESGETREHHRERVAALNELRSGMHPNDTYTHRDVSGNVELRFKR